MSGSSIQPTPIGKQASGSTTHRAPGAALPAGPAVVSYRVWPLASRRCLAEPVPWIALALGAAAWFATQSAGLAALAVAAVALSGWRYFVPVAVRFDGQGIHQAALGRRRVLRWGAVWRVDVRSRGVLVYPVHRRSPLDVLAADFVPFNSHRAEALAWIERFIPISANGSVNHREKANDQ